MGNASSSYVCEFLLLAPQVFDSGLTWFYHIKIRFLWGRKRRKKRREKQGTHPSIPDSLMVRAFNQENERHETF